MGLNLNKEKTKIVEARNKSFDFLGFTFRLDKCLYNEGNKYWNVFPSKKSQKSFRGKIKRFLSSAGSLPPNEVADGLNSKIRGWVNNHTIPGVSYPSKAKSDLEWYLKRRINRYYKRKSQRKSRLFGKGAYKILVDKWGLEKPTAY
ncbi:hypothetical protein MWH25_12720 [Natroniella acetigena]|nr:hypothetical protein [Natroniella acetigena]